MPLPVILVNDFAAPSNDVILMSATPDGAIENRQYPRRFYTFNMVITKPFSYLNTNELALTDNNSTNIYHLVDRLGNPVIAEQLEMYAANRRCLTCQFDTVTNVVRVLSCICPTNKYIQQWLNPPATTETPTN